MAVLVRRFSTLSRAFQPTVMRKVSSRALLNNCMRQDRERQARKQKHSHGEHRVRIFDRDTCLLVCFVLRCGPKRYLTPQLLHFRSFLDRIVHLPVPSEDFAPRGKKIVKIFTSDYRIARMGPSAEHFSEKSSRLIGPKNRVRRNQSALLRFADVNWCTTRPSCRAQACPFGPFPILANRTAFAHRDYAFHSNSILAIAGFPANRATVHPLFSLGPRSV